MLGTLGQGTTFWIYAGLNVVFIFLVFLLVPEPRASPWSASSAI